MHESIKSHKFLNMEEFIEELIDILHKGEMIPITMEEFKMLDFLKKDKNIGADKNISINRTNKTRALRKKPSNASEYHFEESRDLSLSLINKAIEDSG